MLRNYSEIKDDPTALNRQGSDVGDQYHSLIFFYNPKELAAKLSEEKLKTSEKFKYKKFVTEIIPASEFYIA